jgi:hypothetical protein
MTPESTFAYCIVRKELSGGALLAHVFHAGREAKGPTASEDERICVLIATKDEMAWLSTKLQMAGIPFKACVETDGPMAGSTPSIGFSLLLKDKPTLKPVLGNLQVWSDRVQRRPEPTPPASARAALPEDKAHGGSSP